MKRRVWIGCSGAIVVLLLISGACLVSLMAQPPTWRVTRTRTIAATPSRVREQLIELHRYVACCGTPETQATTPHYGSSTEGPGASMEWDVPGGTESMTIESVGEDRVVMRYLVGGKVSHQTIQWRAIDSRTEVTWIVEGDKSGFLQRLIWPVAEVESHVSGAIDTSLEGLERAAR